MGRALGSLSDKKKEHSARIMDEETISHQAENLGKSQSDILWPVFERSLSKAGWKLAKTEIATEGYEICFE